MSINVCFFADILTVPLKKKFCQHFHGSNVKQLFYDFCQKISECEIYCFFAQKTAFDNCWNENKKIY